MNLHSLTKKNNLKSISFNNKNYSIEIIFLTTK